MPLSDQLILSIAASCLTMAITTSAPAQTASQIPDYFFSEWRITRDCTEAHATTTGHTTPGLKLRVARKSASPDGLSYRLEVLNERNKTWRAGWSNIRLEYRAGTPMRVQPADFTCIPGEEASSPFLAMGGYAISAEPYYEYEHWYGRATIHGQLHHVLIFPRAGSTEGPVIVLHDAENATGISLDHDGIIHTEQGA